VKRLNRTLFGALRIGERFRDIDPDGVSRGGTLKKITSPVGTRWTARSISVNHEWSYLCYAPSDLVEVESDQPSIFCDYELGDRFLYNPKHLSTSRRGQRVKIVSINHHHQVTFAFESGLRRGVRLEQLEDHLIPTSYNGFYVFYGE
jgi:hypothetical protein